MKNVKNPSADDVFPMLVYVILQSNPKYLLSNVE